MIDLIVLVIFFLRKKLEILWIQIWIFPVQLHFSVTVYYISEDVIFGFSNTVDIFYQFCYFMDQTTHQLITKRFNRFKCWVQL